MSSARPLGRSRSRCTRVLENPCPCARRRENFTQTRSPLLKVAMAANVVTQARGKKAQTAGRNVVWENVKSLLGAILIYLVSKTFLFEAYRIPSGSMIHTLLVGDWLFVN